MVLDNPGRGRLFVAQSEALTTGLAWWTSQTSQSKGLVDCRGLAQGLRGTMRKEPSDNMVENLGMIFLSLEKRE